MKRQQSSVFEDADLAKDNLNVWMTDFLDITLSTTSKLIHMLSTCDLWSCRWQSPFDLENKGLED